jgi:hypothetical protein
MVIGDGQTAKFWEDRWITGQSIRETAPLLYACIPKRWRKIRTVADGLANQSWARDILGVLGIHEVGQYLRLWRTIEHTTLCATADKMVWRWNKSGTYTAKSAYLASFQGSTSCRAWQRIWKLGRHHVSNSSIGSRIWTVAGRQTG